MKRIEIKITEENLKDESEVKEFKHATAWRTIDESITLSDDFFKTLLQDGWADVMNRFLEDRNHIPFTPVKYLLVEEKLKKLIELEDVLEEFGIESVEDLRVYIKNSKHYNSAFIKMILEKIRRKQ